MKCTAALSQNGLLIGHKLSFKIKYSAVSTLHGAQEGLLSATLKVDESPTTGQNVHRRDLNLQAAHVVC